MFKPGVTLGIIFAALAVLLLDGIGIIRFDLSEIFLQILNAIAALISAVFLVLIIGMDLVLVVLIARTPNRWWQPRV